MTWELRHTEVETTRRYMINKNFKHNINHKMLFYEQITSNSYQYPV